MATYSIGNGTRNNSKVMWLSSPPEYDRAKLDKTIQQQAYNMGQAYAWVVKGIQNTITVQKKNVENKNTLEVKTLRTMAQDADHVTDRFGPSDDKCTVHDHLYTHMIDKVIGNDTVRVSSGTLMTDDKRSYAGGRSRHS
ncbi:hypothetical protein F5Y18DRAFT_428055 [Xylariaceae sp. FL1019]|nr:hypothetical protein F5Y18DRAFT_428055 [Xylariaceae sp. FL1019]